METADSYSKVKYHETSLACRQTNERCKRNLREYYREHPEDVWVAWSLPEEDGFRYAALLGVSEGRHLVKRPFILNHKTGKFERAVIDNPPPPPKESVVQLVQPCGVIKALRKEWDWDEIDKINENFIKSWSTKNQKKEPEIKTTIREWKPADDCSWGSDGESWK
jgi:hypothetical protein